MWGVDMVECPHTNAHACYRGVLTIYFLMLYGNQDICQIVMVTVETLHGSFKWLGIELAAGIRHGGMRVVQDFETSLREQSVMQTDDKRNENGTSVCR
jgi:hypothetical protein